MLCAHTRHHLPVRTLTPVIDGAVARSGFEVLCKMGRFIRVSAKTRSWEKAETEAHAMEDISDSQTPRNGSGI
jgi:hypothetical protein